jgi:hypothetical protein
MSIEEIEKRLTQAGKVMQKMDLAGMECPRPDRMLNCPVCRNSPEPGKFICRMGSKIREDLEILQKLGRTPL